MEQLPIFVYGTLLPGQPNAYMWADSVKKVETAVFPQGLLYDMGHYPMLVEEPGGSIIGAIFTLHNAHFQQVVQRLDELEDYNPQAHAQSPYRREKRIVGLRNGRSIQAWTYLGNPSYVKGMPPITSGDWVSHASKKGTPFLDWWANVTTVKGLLTDNNDATK
ncbi:MAG: gamma-glutamylcyclotransferase [Anaerolineales bacterium]|nr:gamma-glutamylcyclotransferase [Anaerolineales bacterium]